VKLLFTLCPEFRRSFGLSQNFFSVSHVPYIYPREGDEGHSWNVLRLRHNRKNTYRPALISFEQCTYPRTRRHILVFKYISDTYLLCICHSLFTYNKAENTSFHNFHTSGFLFLSFFLSFFLPFLVGPLLPTHCRWRGLLLHLITLRHTICSRITLDEGSASRRDLYLTTHNTHERWISMARRDSNSQSQ
jgi:hypothetical protein